MIAQPYKSTVSTAAASFDLTVLATVKEELAITDTDADAKLTRLIAMSSAAVEKYCNRVFAQETLIDTFRLNDDGAVPCLLLSRMPVSSISSVVEDGTTLTAADYELVAAKGELWRVDSDDEQQNWENAKIVVTFVAGYELLDGLPQDVERAAIELVKQGWFALSRDPLVKSEDVPGVLSTAYWVGEMGDNGAVPPHAASLLDKYRIIPI